jgi:putative ABC transport system substrate-binding protein
MRRRGFLGALGSAAVAWPLASRAQQTSLPVVGFLHSASAAANQKRRAAFLDCLTATGYVAGRNVTIEYRWADGEFVRLPLLAEQLVRHPVSVLVAFAPPTVLAAKAATAAIPIVFFMGGDPVKLGLVQSFSRPGGNITGIAAMTISLVAKRLELIRSLVPHADTIRPIRPLQSSSNLCTVLRSRWARMSSSLASGMKLNWKH